MPQAVLRMRGKHEELVLRLLRRHGPLSRGELIDMSGLSRTTLYDIVVPLVDNGTVTVSIPEVARRKRGRPVEKLDLSPHAGQVIGIDFARQAVRVAVMGIAHEDIGTAGEQHAPQAPWRDRVETAYRLVGGLMGRTPRLGSLSAIGVGVGVAEAAAAPGADHSYAQDHRTVAESVRERFGAPVRVDSNTRLAALAESQWGAAAGERDVLYLQLSYGVGGGLVVDGTLHRGAYGRSGEFGHITVAPDGPACGCGGTGCLEAVASVGAVLDSYRAAGGTAGDLPELVTALDGGDRRARAVLTAAGARVGRALATLSHTVDPRVIVVGGELAEVGPPVTRSIEREVALGPLRGARAQLRLRWARLGEMSAALGAVALLRPEVRDLMPRRGSPSSRCPRPGVPGPTDGPAHAEARASDDVGAY
ncbi:ROK family protein [Streptomyces sp. NPDC056464]|uniref:ROK family transcriptional regulator n=1 Tax=Streptomyces sp. NPDC056464 TaxID=3345828 RepID=UPI0036901BD8